MDRLIDRCMEMQNDTYALLFHGCPLLQSAGYIYGVRERYTTILRPQITGGLSSATGWESVYCSCLLWRNRFTDRTPCTSCEQSTNRQRHGSDGRLCDCIRRKSSFEVAWTEGFIPRVRSCGV
jgi:hypothetical protein